METKVIQKQDDSYNTACQNCGTTSKPLQMIPLRDDDHVVGLIMSCNDCKDELYGQKFDRECKLPYPSPPPDTDKKQLAEMREDILKRMQDEMPFILYPSIKPYILEAMEVYHTEAIATLIQPQEEAKERYDKACIWLTKQNTKEISGPMMLTLFKTLQIASGYNPSKPNQINNE